MAWRTILFLREVWRGHILTKYFINYESSSCIFCFLNYCVISRSHSTNLFKDIYIEVYKDSLWSISSNIIQNILFVINYVHRCWLSIIKYQIEYVGLNLNRFFYTLRTCNKLWSSSIVNLWFCRKNKLPFCKIYKQ